MENMNGKEFVFQIQLNHYNLKYGWEFFTVKKVFESFEEIDKVIQLDKMTKYVLFNIAKLQIWFLTSICCNTFLNLFYCQAYIISNEYNNKLSSEQDGDSTKFQKVYVQSYVQLTPTSVIKENKMAYFVTSTKQQRKKIQRTL